MAKDSKEPKRDLVEVLDLTGGLDRRTSPTLLKPDRSRQNHNARLSVAGRWTPAPGWETFSTTTLSGRVQGGARIYLSGVAPFTLAAFAGSVYKPSDVGVYGAAVLSGLSANNAVDFPSDATMVAVFDGSSQPKRSVDGTTWVALGVVAPTVAASLGVTTGGSLIAAHQYEAAYTYEGNLDAFESNESPVGVVTTGTTTLTVRVTVTGTSDPQVANIDVYARDVTLGESVRRFAGTVANPGAVTAVVTLTSNTWSDADEAPTTHDSPGPFAFGVVWKNRWWAVDNDLPTSVRFSELFLPQAWPETYSFDVPFTKGDRITALIPMGDVMLVLGSGAQGFLVFAQTALDFDIRPTVGILAGCFGFRAWALIEGGAVHAAAEGVYVFDGATDRLLSYDFEDDWRDLVSQADVDDLDRLAVFHHRRDKELRIAAPTLPLYGAPGEWKLDLARTQVRGIAAWSTTDRPIGGYLCWDGPEPVAGNRGRLFSWGFTAGDLCEESVGTSADGADQSSQYQGPVLSTEFYVSDFTHCVGEYLPADGVFNVTVTVDGVDVVSKTVGIGGNLSRYGESLYGTATYGGAARRMFSIDLPTSANGRGVSVSGTYLGQEPFEWYNYAVRREIEPEIRGIV